MGLISSMGISRSALQVERMRMDVVANNIANMNSTRTSTGGPYHRQEVLIRAQNGIGAPTFQSLIAGRSGTTPGGVSADAVVDDKSPLRRVYEPTNPDAGADGYVEYPNVDLSLEMTDMISANRSYQANVTALNAIKGMAQKAIEIGR